ncbi:UNVERIFIED_ORG: hypothetical protein M2442_002413 [Methylorubrum zatmanii]|nr:hypothetical protein [Methylorubrum zatmanii]
MIVVTTSRRRAPARGRVGDVVGQGLKRLAVLGGGADRHLDHFHDALDLGDEARIHPIHLHGHTAAVDVGVVEPLDVGAGQRAVLRREPFDRIVHQRLRAGDVEIPHGVGPRRRAGTVVAHQLEAALREHETAITIGIGAHPVT